MRVAVYGLLLSLLATIAPAPSSAQGVQRIAAIVNDEIISGYDIEQRIRLVMASTKMADTPDNRRRLRGQVLRSLIDEQLQIQAADRFGIAVRDADFDRAFRFIEQQNNVPTGQIDRFLVRAGIPKDALRQQMKAEIAWSKLVRRRISPNVQIGEEEVNEVLDRLRQNAGKPEYRVSEIFLPIDNPELDDEVRRSALRLIEQLQGGAAFSAMARQFSRGATAATGGSVGWVQPGQMATELERALASMSRNEVSQPIRASGGYYILLLHEQRVIARSDPLDATLDLRQLLVTVGADASAADRDAKAAEARRLAADIDGCGDIAARAGAGSIDGYTNLGTLKLSDMPARIRDAVQDLAEGQFSEPIQVDEGWLMLMVCKREAPKSAIPEREAIVQNLTRQRMSMLAQRYMRDLRRDAVVELR